MNDFISYEQMMTFAGLVSAIMITIQGIKLVLAGIKVDIENKGIYPILVFIVAFVYLVVFNRSYLESMESIILAILNSIMLAFAAMGIYDNIDNQDEYE